MKKKIDVLIENTLMHSPVKLAQIPGALMWLLMDMEKSDTSEARKLSSSQCVRLTGPSDHLLEDCTRVYRSDRVL